MDEPTPYINVPFLPLENQDQDSRHGAHFFRNVKQLQVGFGSKVFRVDRDGMWAGAEDFATAPWSVDWNGNMIASSLVISGYIPTGGALTDIGAGNITGTYIANGSISTAKIQANAITANEILAGAVTASKINVSSLSAISANIGTITAGSLSAVSISAATITGSTLSTATSGQRVVLTSTLAEFYNSSGTKIVQTYAGSNSYLIDGQSASTSIVLDAGSSGAVVIQNNGSNIIIVDSNGIYCNSDNTFDLGQASFSFRDFYLDRDFTYRGIDQPVLYHGYVSGTSIFDDNTSFSVSNPSAGRYTVTHNLGTSNYQVQLTPAASTVKNITLDSLTSSSFGVRIANLSDALENNDFMFLLTLLA